MLRFNNWTGNKNYWIRDGGTKTLIPAFNIPTIAQSQVISENDDNVWTVLGLCGEYDQASNE